MSKTKLRTHNTQTQKTKRTCRSRRDPRLIQSNSRSRSEQIDVERANQIPEGVNPSRFGFPHIKSLKNPKNRPPPTIDLCVCPSRGTNQRQGRNEEISRRRRFIATTLSTARVPEVSKGVIYPHSATPIERNDTLVPEA